MTALNDRRSRSLARNLRLEQERLDRAEAARKARRAKAEAAALDGASQGDLVKPQTPKP